MRRRREEHDELAARSDALDAEIEEKRARARALDGEIMAKLAELERRQLAIVASLNERGNTEGSEGQRPAGEGVAGEKQGGAAATQTLVAATGAAPLAASVPVAQNIDDLDKAEEGGGDALPTTTRTEVRNWGFVQEVGCRSFFMHFVLLSILTNPQNITALHRWQISPRRRGKKEETAKRKSGGSRGNLFALACSFSFWLQVERLGPPSEPPAARRGRAETTMLPSSKGRRRSLQPAATAPVSAPRSHLLLSLWVRPLRW